MYKNGARGEEVEAEEEEEEGVIDISSAAARAAADQGFLCQPELQLLREDPEIRKAFLDYVTERINGARRGRPPLTLKIGSAGSSCFVYIDGHIRTDLVSSLAGSHARSGGRSPGPVVLIPDEDGAPHEESPWPSSFCKPRGVEYPWGFGAIDEAFPTFAENFDPTEDRHVYTRVVRFSKTFEGPGHVPKVLLGSGLDATTTPGIENAIIEEVDIQTNINTTLGCTFLSLDTSERRDVAAVKRLGMRVSCGDGRMNEFSACLMGALHSFATLSDRVPVVHAIPQALTEFESLYGGLSIHTLESVLAGNGSDTVVVDTDRHPGVMWFLAANRHLLPESLDPLSPLTMAQFASGHELHIPADTVPSVIEAFKGQRKRTGVDLTKLYMELHPDESMPPPPSLFEQLCGQFPEIVPTNYPEGCVISGTITIRYRNIGAWHAS